MSTTFKKRPVSPAQVAKAESAAAASPIVGDPRLKGDSGAPGSGSHAPIAPAPAARPLAEPLPKVGASQDGGGGGQGQDKFEVGRVYDVPLGRIKSNPFNPRAVYTATAVDEMASSLTAHGQRVAATGFLGEAGDVVLIEGETRLRGARVGGLPTLRVEIRPQPADDRALYEEARAANVERRDQTALDDALRWKELLAKKVYSTQAALAKALGLTEDHVSRTISLATLPQRLIHALAEERELLTLKMLNAVREYWEKAGDEKTLELILEVSQAGMGYRDVVSRRKALEHGPIKRPRSTKEAVSFFGAKGELKTFEEGRVELVLKGLSAEATEKLTAQIKVALGSGMSVG